MMLIGPTAKYATTTAAIAGATKAAVGTRRFAFGSTPISTHADCPIPLDGSSAERQICAGVQCLAETPMVHCGYELNPTAARRLASVAAGTVTVVLLVSS